MNPSQSSVAVAEETFILNSTTPEISTSRISSMDVKLFKAAQEGNIAALTEHRDELLQMLTPTKSTVLHVFIASIDAALLTKSPQSVGKSADVAGKMLKICERLLLQDNENGDTALHLAARYGRAEIVEVLMQAAKAWDRDLEAGASSTQGWQQTLIRKPNKKKNTALHEAVRFNHLDVVKILTENDPDFLYAANDAGETPLFIAAERGYSRLVGKILDTCSNPSYQGPNGRTALHIAAAYDYPQITKKLLEKKRTLALEPDRERCTPLHLAARNGCVSVVKQILECDASAAYISNNNKSTPVHLAAQTGRVDVLELLLQYCPDSFELVDSNGWNALHYAISGNKHKVERFVRQDPWLSNILLNGKNSNGNAPLHEIAKSDKQYRGVEFVCDPRVDKMTSNNDHMTAVDFIRLNARSVDSWQRPLELVLNEFGARVGERISKKEFEEGGNKVDAEKERGKNESSEDSKYKEIKESHMVVSALIATVTFAAGFTVPGGYQSQGRAVLSRNAAFKAFIITNTLAMCMASCAVMIRFSLAMSRREFNIFTGPYALAIQLTMYGVDLMVFAFLAGTYAVLGGHESSDLAIVATVLGYFFYFFVRTITFYRNMYATIRDRMSVLQALVGLPIETQMQNTSVMFRYNILSVFRYY